MIFSPVMALACAAVFGGAIVQGIVGFGMGLLSASVTLRALGPQLMAPVNVGLAVIMNASLFFKLRKNADWSIIAPLLIGSPFGIWLGTYLPQVIPAQTFKTCFGVFVALSGAVLWSGWKCSAEGFLPRMAVGFASGILSGSISLGAPPVAIFLTAGSTPKHVFRSSVSAYLTAQNVMSAIAFGLRGAYTGDYFKGFAALLPFVMGGVWLGARFASRVNEAAFRRVVMVLIIISGLSLLL